jgi:hypothetical protein
MKGMDPKTNGRAALYLTAKQIQEVMADLDKNHRHYTILQSALQNCYRGIWLDEEQLKAMYKLDWREGDARLNWLDDDFD